MPNKSNGNKYLIQKHHSEGCRKKDDVQDGGDFNYIHYSYDDYNNTETVNDDDDDWNDNDNDDDEHDKYMDYCSNDDDDDDD